MRYYRLGRGPDARLVARTDAGAFDLTSARPDLASFRDLVGTAATANEDADAVATRLREEAEAMADESLETDDLSRPVVPDEVWAAGVTYRISEAARESESGTPDLYLDVYGHERPEIFFKATPARTVGPGDAVGIRGDSTWNVPEPELAVVLYQGAVVGYTIGVDVSSRSIEGENPLYLPQAKIYDRCCALGPCVASPSRVPDPHDLEIRMAIHDDSGIVYEGVTSTRRMQRECPELVSWYTRHDAVPELSVLLTGTSLVPDDDFTLREGQTVEVEVESIGTLHNPVTVV